MTCVQRLQQVLAVTLPVRDILEQRVDDALVPAWCETRGWTRFLLELEDAALQSCEAHGLAQPLPTLTAAPATLLALAREVTAPVTLPIVAGTTALSPATLRNVRLRKRAQLSG